MPSANTENNLIYMKYVKNSQKEDEGKNVDKSYHIFENTFDYFPTITLQKDYIPYGDPEPYCFHLSWAVVDESKMPDKYKDFNGLHKCEQVEQGYSQWPSDDPKTGIDVRIWREDEYSLGTDWKDKCEEICETRFIGIYKNNIWYVYYVAERIVFKVEEESDDVNDPQNQIWNVSGEFLELNL